MASATRSRVKCQPCRLDHADRTCFQTVHNGNIYGEQTSCDFVTPVAASRQPVPPRASAASCPSGHGASQHSRRVANCRKKGAPANQWSAGRRQCRIPCGCGDLWSAQKKGPCNEHGPQETREASNFWSGSSAKIAAPCLQASGNQQADHLQAVIATVAIDAVAIAAAAVAASGVTR